MHDASGWCQSLTSSLLVAILVLAFLALVAWVVIDSIYAQFNKIIKGVTDVLTPMFQYIQAIYEYIRNRTGALRTKLETLSDNIAEKLSGVFNTDEQKLKTLLKDKIDAYANLDKDKLKILNDEVSKLIMRDRRQMGETMSMILNDIDMFLLNSDIKLSEMSKVLNSKISTLVGYMSVVA